MTTGINWMQFNRKSEIVGMGIVFVDVCAVNNIVPFIHLGPIPELLVGVKLRYDVSA